MSAYLIENSDILKLDKDSFENVFVLDEEIALKKGKKDSGGRIDLLVNYSDDYLGIVELKKGEINDESLKQLENYLDQRLQILEIPENNYWESETEPKWIGVLVGNEISPSLREKLLNGYVYQDNIPIAGMTIRRFRNPNSSEIFVVTDTFFKFKYGSKDYSRFIFNGVSGYNKGKLVNAVIKKVVEDNPEITFAELKQKFPDKISGRGGVFNLKEKADELLERTGNARHYIKPDEIIVLADDVLISTSTQWDTKNIKAFIEQAKKMRYKIEVE